MGLTIILTDWFLICNIKNGMKNPKYLDEAFEKVCQELLAMFIKKHKDYGKGNILDMGELGIAFRISEKFNRIKHLLMNNKKATNETIEESWIDIAVYAVVAVLFKRGWFKKLKMKE
jgi:hypothetical protein